MAAAFSQEATLIRGTPGPGARSRAGRPRDPYFTTSMEVVTFCPPFSS